MSEKQYYQDFEEFMAANPDINPEWRPFIEPVIQAEDDALFRFILTYIFM